MAFKITQSIDDASQVSGCVEFNVKFTPKTAFNSLFITHNREVIASDANVEDETYCLPSGDYVVRVRFQADPGTEGTMTITTPTATKVRKAKVGTNHGQATIPAELEL